MDRHFGHDAFQMIGLREDFNLGNGAVRLNRQTLHDGAAIKTIHALGILNAYAEDPARQPAPDLAFQYRFATGRRKALAMDHAHATPRVLPRLGQEIGQRALDLLEKVGLKGFEDAYPKALSQGMRQRVALARTFSLDSPILLMDEPFGALDAQTKLQLEDVLLSLWQRERRTVLYITHDLSEAVSMSDRVIVMSSRPGRIIADVPITLGRPSSVRALQKEAHYHELYSQVWSYL